MDNLQEVKFEVLRWAIDSLTSHRLNRVIIAFDDSALTGMILWPKA